MFNVCKKTCNIKIIMYQVLLIRYICVKELVKKCYCYCVNHLWCTSVCFACCANTYSWILFLIKSTAQVSLCASLVNCVWHNVHCCVSHQHKTCIMCMVYMLFVIVLFENHIVIMKYAKLYFILMNVSKSHFKHRFHLVSYFNVDVSFA